MNLFGCSGSRPSGLASATELCRGMETNWHNCKPRYFNSLVS